MLGHHRGHALTRDPSFFSREREERQGSMPTGSTGHHLAAFGVEVTELIESGSRMRLHTFADDLLPFGINTRWSAATMRLGA